MKHATYNQNILWLSQIVIFGCLLWLPLLGIGAEPTEPVLEDSEPSVIFNSSQLFHLLLAEIAWNRDEPLIAVQQYQRLISTHKNPILAKRATEIALSVNAIEKCHICCQSLG